MKSLARALLFSLALSSFAHADDASKRTKVEELIRLTKVNDLLNQMTDQMATRMRASAAQQSASHSFTPAQEKLINEYIDQVQSITRSAVSWEKIKPTLIQVYTETYTDQELDGIITFYRSPAGQAMIAKSPQLMNKTVQLVQSQMGEVQPQLVQANQEFSRKMKELNSAPQPQPSTQQPAPAPKQ